MTKTIAERLQVIKKETGAIYTEIAKELGVHASTVGKWFSGKRKPNTETVKRLAKYFNVDPSEIDETLSKAKRVFKYADPSQPSVKKTQAFYISVNLRAFKAEHHLTVSDIYEALGKKVSLFTLEALMYGRQVPNQEFFKAFEEAFGIDREQLDPFFVNGREIDFGRVIHLRALTLLAETNVTSGDVDREMGVNVNTFYNAFIACRNGKYRVPSYNYIKDVADVFEVDPSEIDPFTTDVNKIKQSIDF